MKKYLFAEEKKQFRKRLQLQEDWEEIPEVVPQLAHFSEHVVTRPADWPEHVVITGYWDLKVCCHIASFSLREARPICSR